MSIIRRNKSEISKIDLLPQSRADIPLTFELDQILRDYAQEILSNAVTRSITHPLEKTRERILTWVREQLK